MYTFFKNIIYTPRKNPSLKLSSLVHLILLIILLIYSSLALINCNKNNELYEQEPNSLLKNATPIKLNKPIKGNFDSLNDKDTFVIDLQNLNSHAAFNISLSNIQDYDTQITLYEGNTIIKSVDDNRKNSIEQLNNIILQNKIYYILISISDLQTSIHKANLQNIKKSNFPSSNYTLSITPQDISMFYEQEPNDSFLYANKIELDKFIEGSFIPFYNKASSNTKFPYKHSINKIFQNLDLDWYYFDLGDEDLKVSIILDGKPFIDAILAIYAEDFYRVIDSRKAGFGERIDNLALKPNKRYYIVVAGVPHAYKYNLEEDFIYRLSIKSILSSKDQAFESEINNSLEKANIININDYKSIKGTLSTIDDNDYFILHIKKNKSHNSKDKDSDIASFKGKLNTKELNKQKIPKRLKELIVNPPPIEYILPNRLSTTTYSLFASLSGVDGVDIALLIFDVSGKLLRVYDNNGVGEGENINTFSTNALKSIIFCVRGSVHNTSYNYKKPYVLKVELRKVLNNYELEPNDIKHKINKIHPNKMIYGYINPSNKNPMQHNDIDFFEAKLQGNRKYQVVFVSPNDMSALLSIYYKDGRIVEEFPSMKSINGKIKRQILKTPHIPFDPMSNIYNIKIESEFASSGNSNIPYRFTIKELPQEN